MHRVREAVRLPQRAGGSSHIHGEQEGQQGRERVAVVQVGMFKYRAHQRLMHTFRSKKWASGHFLLAETNNSASKINVPVSLISGQAVVKLLSKSKLVKWRRVQDQILWTRMTPPVCVKVSTWISTRRVFIYYDYYLFILFNYDLFYSLMS